MAAAMVMPAAVQDFTAGPSRPAKRQPYIIDFSCPLSLPDRPLAGSSWPFAYSGPMPKDENNEDKVLRRRYLETLYMPETIFRLKDFVEDVTNRCQGLDDTAKEDVVQSLGKAHLQSLQQLERRHRKVIAPLLKRMSSEFTATASVLETVMAESSDAECLDKDEIEALRVALELRVDSRMAEENGAPEVKTLASQLEKRETLMQVALLFAFLSTGPDNKEPKAKKRRKHKNGQSSDAPSSPMDDPKGALELMMDRLGVWNAVAELELGDVGEKGRIPENWDSFPNVSRHFWEDIIVPNFLATHRDLCSSLHQKVFGHPMPEAPLPTPVTTKKPRKPKFTRARPSSDTLPVPQTQSQQSFTRPMVRAPSKAPSESGSRVSVNDEPPAMRRSLSRRSESVSEYGRSRSRSIDPAPVRTESSERLGDPGAQARRMVRAPSGKDLFKGRQVGFMRRTSSVSNRRDSQSQTQGEFRREESQSSLGLLGRKVSQAGKIRNESQSLPQTGSSDTLIFATPSKPKLADSIFGPRIAQFQAPTPIMEEPSSSERTSLPSLIAETPINPGRPASHFLSVSSSAKFQMDGVAGTPEVELREDQVMMFSTKTNYAKMPISQMSLENSEEEDDEDYVDDAGEEEEEDDEGSEDSDDPLGALMVMTDEEDLGDDTMEDHTGLGGFPFAHEGIPDTPR